MKKSKRKSRSGAKRQKTVFNQLMKASTPQGVHAPPPTYAPKPARASARSR